MFDDDDDDEFHERRSLGALPQIASVRGMTVQQRAADLTLQEERERQARVLYLTLLTQDGTWTELAPPIRGDAILNDYSGFFRNDTAHPLRVQVFASFSVGGSGVKISTMPDASDAGLIDTLALVANGKTESVSTILLPTMSLWLRNFDSAFPMVAADVVRIRVFDPQRLLSYAQLFARR